MPNDENPDSTADDSSGAHSNGDSTNPLDSDTTQPGGSPDVPRPRPLLREDAIPGYQLRRLIDSGGQGEVYEAIQLSIGKRRAIKVLRNTATDAESRGRFEREVEILAALRHPNIVTIIDRGRVEERWFYVMEYVSGQPLDIWLREKLASLASRTKIPKPGDPRNAVANDREFIDSVVRAFIKICDAMEVAHVCGVVHRDLKPGNIRVDEHDEPHILDFGLAKMMAADGDLTTDGSFRGSMIWASPEQIEGKVELDKRSDVYSLGVILYRMLTGVFPYSVEPRDIVNSVCNVAPVKPRKRWRAIDADLQIVVLKCLAKERRARYADAGELSRDLSRYLSGQSIEARRESIGYQLASAAGRIVRKQATVARLTIVLLAVIASYVFSYSLVFYKSSIDTVFRNALFYAAGNAPPIKKLDHVRIIALRDISKTAAAAGFSSAEQFVNDRQKIRLIHTALCKKLAGCGASSLGFDIFFRKEAIEDVAFAEAISALAAAKPPTGVALAVPDWALDGDSHPILSPRLYGSAASWGVPIFDANPATSALEWYRLHGRDTRMTSFALATLAAAWHPGMRFGIDVAATMDQLRLEFWRPDTVRLGERIPVVESEWLPFTARITTRAAPVYAGATQPSDTEPRLAIDIHDDVGHFVVVMPEKRALDIATRDYADVLSADAATLKDWFVERIVLVGDFRENGDEQYRLRGGVSYYGTEVNAVAIEQLKRGIIVHTPGNYQYEAYSASAALLGLLIALFLFDRLLVRTLALAASATLIIIGTFLVFGAFYLVINPAVLCLSMWITAESVAAFERFRVAGRG